MSSRREVLIRILALLQRKTLIETRNRTLKCLKRHYSTVRSMINVAELTKDGAFALFFCPHPGGFDSSRVPTSKNLPSKAKKKNANARKRKSRKKKKRKEKKIAALTRFEFGTLSVTAQGHEGFLERTVWKSFINLNKTDVIITVNTSKWYQKKWQMETPFEEKASDRHYHNLKIAQKKFHNTPKSP